MKRKTCLKKVNDTECMSNNSFVSHIQYKSYDSITPKKVPSSTNARGIVYTSMAKDTCSSTTGTTSFFRQPLDTMALCQSINIGVDNRVCTLYFFPFAVTL